MPFRIGATGAVLATVMLTRLLEPGPALSAANDPYLGTWKWPTAFGGTYHYHAPFTRSWMQSAVNRANATIGHSDYQNPDFHLTTSSSTNGSVELLSNTNSCAGSFGWTACATYSPSAQTWNLWFATQRCWSDGTNQTCSDEVPYDVETVALNEMGHVNTLAHHVPAVQHYEAGSNYDDAVVQKYADPVGHPFGTNRALRWADLGALRARYGSDPCPCPQGAEP